MPTCYIVPGFLASELFNDPARKTKLWINKISLGYGRAYQMQLAFNGVTPGSPFGARLYVGGPLPDVWAAPMSTLQMQLDAAGYSIVPFGFDWRMSFFIAGEQLTARILSDVSASDPCTIVAHSYGGLAARYAWWRLGQSGLQNRVRRIITLGTPHQGSYNPVELWSGGGTYLQQMIQLNIVLNGALVIPRGVVPPSLYTPLSLIQVTQSWPAMYELLPTVGGPQTATDPLRTLLYQGSAWRFNDPDFGFHLDDALNVTSPWLIDPVTFPPPWVLTTVAGTGFPTPYGQLDPQRCGIPGTFGTTNDGDGVVTSGSALVTASAQYTLLARHTDMVAASVQNGQLASWILDVRNPPSPAPPLVSNNVVFPPTLTDPPDVQVIGSVGAASAAPVFMNFDP